MIYEHKTYLEIPVTVQYELSGEDIIIGYVAPDCPVKLTKLQRTVLHDAIEVDLIAQSVEASDNLYVDTYRRE